MPNEKEKPGLMDTAGLMALPVGLLWAASFLSTIYGAQRPLLSSLGTVLPLISVFTLHRQLTNYCRLFRPVSWGQVMRLSLAVCLLAGLLTDAVQYAYFLFFDQGRLLSNLCAAMESPEYREAWKQMMPDVPPETVQQTLGGITIRDIMLQIVMFNILLAVPFSLIASIIPKKLRE